MWIALLLASFPPPPPPDPNQVELHERATQALEAAIAACRTHRGAINVLIADGPTHPFIEVQATSEALARCIRPLIDRALTSKKRPPSPTAVEISKRIGKDQLPDPALVLRTWRDALQGKRGADAKLERLLPPLIHRRGANCIYRHNAFRSEDEEETLLLYAWLMKPSKKLAEPYTVPALHVFEDLLIEHSDIELPSGPGFMIHEDAACVTLLDPTLARFAARGILPEVSIGSSYAPPFWVKTDARGISIDAAACQGELDAEIKLKLLGIEKLPRDRMIAVLPDEREVSPHRAV